MSARRCKSVNFHEPYDECDRDEGHDGSHFHDGGYYSVAWDFNLGAAPGGESE